MWYQVPGIIYYHEFYHMYLLPDQYWYCGYSSWSIIWYWTSTSTQLCEYSMCYQVPAIIYYNQKYLPVLWTTKVGPYLVDPMAIY